MADAGTRLCVGIVGTSTIGRIRVNLGAEETVVRAELVTKAAKKLCVRPQGPCGARAHEGPRAVVVHRQDQALRRLRSVQEGMPLSQLPRQVYQEGDRQCAGGRAATRRWSSRRPITGATSGGSYSSRRRRERASWTVGVSCVCSSGAICKRAGAMADANRPHAPHTGHRALRKKIAPAHTTIQL